MNFAAGYASGVGSGLIVAAGILFYLWSTEVEQVRREIEQSTDRTNALALEVGGHRVMLLELIERDMPCTKESKLKNYCLR